MEFLPAWRARCAHRIRRDHEQTSATMQLPLPLGRLTLADTPPIEAEILFR